MTEETWNKHTPGDPMPCKCGDSVVEVRLRAGVTGINRAGLGDWGKIKDCPRAEITDWRFAERKGKDVIAADPYNDLEWDEDDTATVALKKPGQPGWVRDDDLVRFAREQSFYQAMAWHGYWNSPLAFQIKRRPHLTPAEQQLLALLAVATPGEDYVIRSAARRANIEVPK